MFGPMIFSTIISFFKWNGLSDPVELGLGNFVTILGDEVFLISVRNTLIYSAVSLLIVVPLAMFLAIALDSPLLKGKLICRAIYFAPIVTSSVAIAQTFSMLFNRDFGLINGALIGLGISPVDWLNTRHTALIPVSILIIWRWLGLTSIYFLAGLQGIDKEIYEAARVDGAHAGQRFWNITLPQLKPMTFFVSTIVLIGSMQIFDEPQVLTKGGPSNATRSVVQYLYLRAFEQFRFGYASTIGLVLFMAIILSTLIQAKLKGDSRL